MGYREPMFLITDAAGQPVGAVTVEDGRWVGRDTTGRPLFNRKDKVGAARAARPHGRLISSAWYGIRATRPDQTRSERILRDRRGLPYVTDPWPMYVTECCAATVTITIDDGALCCRACYTTVDAHVIAPVAARRTPARRGRRVVRHAHRRGATRRTNRPTHSPLLAAVFHLRARRAQRGYDERTQGSAWLLRWGTTSGQWANYVSADTTVDHRLAWDPDIDTAAGS